MDKYKRLVSNTLLTAVNQFSSRLLTLLMTMYYTRMMLPELYGTIIAVQTLGQFFIPLVLLGMRDALVRFGLEDGSNKTKVYTNGLLAFAIGYAALLALWPLLYHIPFVKGTVEQYSVLMMVFLFTSCLNTVNCQFTRARGLLRLYAVDGILNLNQNVADGLVVYPKVIRQHMLRELPFMATENIMMDAVKRGGNRQELHERIRVHSMEAAKVVKEQGGENDLLARIAGDPIFGVTLEELHDIVKPEKYVGRAPVQTEEFLTETVAPVLERYKDVAEEAAEITV